MHPSSCFARIVLTCAVAFLSGCVTKIKTDITQNPAPQEPFAAFNRVEMSKIVIAAPYAGQDANERATVKIQENVSLKMDPLLKTWNARDPHGTPTRTLLIEPVVSEIKFISGGVRVWTGAWSGSSAVILTAKISEKETGKVIATPMFYARAAAMGGAWTFGSTDNLMLVRVAGRLTDYLAGNYDAAVGGVTGAEPETSKD